MKWLFAVLLIINAGFFAWHSYRPVPASTTTLSYVPPVSTPVYLLGEEAPLLEVTTSDEAPVRVAEPVLAIPQDRIADSTTVTPDSSSKALLCPLVEFERVGEKDAFLDLLHRQNIAAVVSEGRAQREKFWLYIPAQVNADAAKEVLARLRLKKIDSYLIARGEMKNRISLGLFSSLERALQAQAKVDAQTGYGAQIYQHQRDVSIYQVALENPILETSWQTLIEQVDTSKWLIKIEKNPC